jgi:hypothetical protein
VSVYGWADVHIIYCSLQQNMNVLLTQTISAWGWFTPLAARNSGGDDTIWVQMLVIVILAVSLGIFSLAKTKTNKSEGESQPQSQRKWAKPSAVRHSQAHLAVPADKTFNLSSVARQSVEAKAKTEAKSEDLHKKRERDLQSGMELLGLDFLLSIVENTNGGDDEKDVVIRKLNFEELLRRGELNQAESKALKEYAVNKGNLYGKDIQCEALKNLAKRTAKGKKGKK